MAQKIIITAKQVTAPGDSAFLFFDIDFGNTLGSYLNTSVFFSTGASDFPMGTVKYNQANTDLFAEELKLYFEYQFTNASVPFTSERIGNVVNFYLGNNSTVDYFDWSGFSSIDSDLWSVEREDYTFEETPETEIRENAVVLSRSPFYFQASPVILYDNVLIDLYIYRGDITSVPLTPTITISKYIIQSGQPTISVEIAKILNDYVQNSIVDFATINATTSSSLDSVWCKVDCSVRLAGSELYKVEQFLLAVDGYGLHEELFNPTYDRNVLSTITTHDIYNGAPYPLYFVTKDLVSISVNGVSVPFTFDENINSQYVAYVDIASYIDSSTSFEAVFQYEETEELHVFNVLNECKYDIVYCYFKNKYGYWQQIPFNKLNKKTAEFKSENYNTFITNYGNYNLKEHVNRSYLSNGKDSIVCNTDYINERYNVLFDELLMSTKIYLRENNITRPVNIKTKSFNYKTKLNEKLIQYNFEFENSYNKINII